MTECPIVKEEMIKRYQKEIDKSSTKDEAFAKIEEVWCRFPEETKNKIRQVEHEINVWQDILK